MDEYIHFEVAKLIESNEGYRNKPYKDSVGKLTIGIGHNLTDLGLDDNVIRHQFAIDMHGAEQDCIAIFRSWSTYPYVMQMVFMDMSFNMGRTKLKKFYRMIAAAENKNTKSVIKEMLDSKWARQLPDRSSKLVNILKGEKHE